MNNSYYNAIREIILENEPQRQDLLDALEKMWRELQLSRIALSTNQKHVVKKALEKTLKFDVYLSAPPKAEHELLPLLAAQFEGREITRELIDEICERIEAWSSPIAIYEIKESTHADD